VPYTQAPHVVRQHADALGGKVLVDVTNPVDLGAFEPLDSGFVSPFHSAGELIQSVAPDGVAVVKAFNTTFAGPLLAGAVGGRPLDVFVAGDDADAKDLVAQLILDGGLRDRRGHPRPRPRAGGDGLPTYGDPAIARHGVRIGARCPPLASVPIRKFAGAYRTPRRAWRAAMRVRTYGSRH
jgi:hypothetical protein